MAIIKEGILLASVKSNSITGISVGSSSVNLVLTEGCRISVYNVRNCQCNLLPVTLVVQWGSVFQPFRCSGTLNKREGHSRNPVH